MKKLIAIIAVFISLSVSAQTVASVTLQSQDWAYLIGKNISSVYADSTSASEFRKIRDQIRTANPASWTTNVVITDVPEWVVMAFYRTVKTANAGEIVSRYTAITTQIESKAQLSTQIATFNATIANDFTRARSAGKTIVMDN